MFNKSTEYALRAVIYIAKESTIEHKVGLDNIAQAINSPRSYTSQGSGRWILFNRTGQKESNYRYP